MNPYLVLGVPPEADDKRIRQAYLEAIKAAPPESHPKRFQALHVAYEQIRDEPSRHRYALFNTIPPGNSPLDAFLRAAALVSLAKPPPFTAMKEFLRACART